MEEKELSFEAAMDRLEEIVTQLEQGEAPLEQAIELFQEGMQLSRLCSQKLEQVERKIEMLIENDGEYTKKDFEPPAET